MASLVRFDSMALGFSVVIEDDGRVAYAYLLQDEHIVGDVWLYNCGAAPREPEWRDPSRMPFANPKGYASESLVKPITCTDDVYIDWVECAGRLERVKLVVQGELFAVLAPGVKPGWCRNATQNGPLAKMLEGNA